MSCVNGDITEDIRFADTPTVVNQKLGGSTLLECVARGTPQPEVSWRFGGKKVIPGIKSQQQIVAVNAINAVCVFCNYPND